MVGGPGTFYPDNYVAVAAEHHLTVGKTPTLFDPYAFITRYQVVTMVVRMVLDLQPGLLAMPPASYKATAGWGSDPIHGANATVAEYNGLLDGLNLGTLNPYGFMNRGEAAQVLHNALLALHPVTTTTTSASTTTTTTGSTTTTTSGSTTTTSASTTTSTTVPGPPEATDYSIAGVEQNQVVVTVLDQFGNPLPGVDVHLTSTALEGVNLVLMNNLDIGHTDANGNVAHSWGQTMPGAWGVEQVTATVGAQSSTVGVVQWIYDDRSTDRTNAVAGQQKVSVISGYGPWNGLMLRAYLAPASASLGSGTYVSSTGLVFTVSHTWVSGEAFFVGAISTNTDNKPNWTYNVVP